MSGYWQALRLRVADCAPLRRALRALIAFLIIAWVAPALVGTVVAASGAITGRVFQEAACAGSGGVYNADTATCLQVPR